MTDFRSSSVPILWILRKYGASSKALLYLEGSLGEHVIIVVHTKILMKPVPMADMCSEPVQCN